MIPWARWRRRPPAAPFALRLGLVAALGAILRLGYVLLVQDTAISDDGIVYHLGGIALARGDGVVNPLTGTPTAIHPPGWTMLLALPSLLRATSILAHQIVACLVGTATIMLVGLAGRAVSGPRVGLVAATLAAVYPNFWAWERELASETLVLPLVAAALILSYRFWTAPRLGTLSALGAICGLLVLVRAEQVLLLAVLLLPLVLLAKGLTPRRRLGWFVVACATAAVVVAPWVVYNTGRFENPVILTTSLGVNLRGGNCPGSYYGEHLGHLDPDVWTYHDDRDRCRFLAFGRGDESEKDVVFREAALEYARDHAARLPIVVTARQGRTWGVFRPLQQAHFDRDWGRSSIWVYRAGLVGYWTLLLAGIAGGIVLRRRGAPIFPLLSFVVVVAVATAVTWGQTRFRAPAEPAIVVLAAVSIDVVLRCVRSARGRRSRRRSGGHERRLRGTRLTTTPW